MIKTYKYKLRPTKGQKRTLNQWLGTCRYLYNNALEHRITAYQLGGITISKYDQYNELPQIKKDLPWIAQVYSDVLQEVLDRVHRSMENFWRGAGFPGFQGKRFYNSFTFKRHYSVEQKHIKLPKIGRVRYYNSRLVSGKPKYATITKQVDGWFICIACQITPAKLTDDSQAVGIDLGVKRLATLSDGSFIPNPMYFKQYQRTLRIKQRKLARQTKGGKNWLKTLHQIQKLHLKIKRCRLDYLHKASQCITSQYNIVFVEDLKLQNMTASAKGTLESPGTMVRQKAGLNRSLLDSGFGILLNQLEYKTLHQSGFFARINPAYTSQTCSSCGSTDNASRISQSSFKCTSCSFAENADYNAALNILSSGLDLLPKTWGLARA